MKPRPRTEKKVRLVWLIAGLTAVVFVAYQLSRSQAIHAHSITFDNSGPKLVIECEVVNPTSKSADLIATLQMTKGNQTRFRGPVSIMPITQAVQLDAGQSKTLRFQTDLNASPPALRAQVAIYEAAKN